VIIDTREFEGNMSMIMAIVRNYLRETKQEDKVWQYSNEALSKSYEHFLDTSKKYYPGLKFRGL